MVLWKHRPSTSASQSLDYSPCKRMILSVQFKWPSAVRDLLGNVVLICNKHSWLCLHSTVWQLMDSSTFPGIGHDFLISKAKWLVLTSMAPQQCIRGSWFGEIWCLQYQPHQTHPRSQGQNGHKKGNRFPGYLRPVRYLLVTPCMTTVNNTHGRQSQLWTVKTLIAKFKILQNWHYCCTVKMYYKNVLLYCVW